MTGDPGAGPHAALAFTACDTLRATFAKLSRAFAEAGLDTPETDARFLMRRVLQLPDGALLREPGRTLGEGYLVLADAARRRLLHEPVSRILGERDFYGRTFEVTRDVLDPRPDTETVIEAVLELVARKGWQETPLRIADIGLGSGAILVTLLAELPLAQGVGTDVSLAALACASRNAGRHGVSARFTAANANILDGVTGPFDIIVSNPPYIPSGEIAGLASEVRNYDPLLALEGGDDGLEFYRKIYSHISKLDPSPCVVFEVGAGQADEVAGIFGNQDGTGALWQATYRLDLGGHVRCVTFERQS